MSFIELVCGIVLWFVAYFNLTGRFLGGKSILLCPLYLSRHLLKKNSAFHIVFFEKCSDIVPHTDVAAHALTFGLLCNLCILVLSVIRYILGVPPLTSDVNPINIATRGLLLVEFVSLFISHLVMEFETRKCCREQALLSSSELKTIIKNIEKEYNDFYGKKNN